MLVTIDKDFGDLIVGKGMPHSGMIRLSGFRAAGQAEAILRLVRSYEAGLLAHFILTAEPWRVRVRSVRGE